MYDALTEAIFEHEMFEATAGGTAYGLENVRRVEATWAFERPDIEAALRRMQQEGLVEHERDHWRATMSGLVARERRWQERGLRHPVMKSESASCHDQVIALTASGGHTTDGWLDGLRQQAIQVYLWRHSREDVDQAIAELCARSLARWETVFRGPVPVLLLTAEGQRHYARNVVAQLGICPPHTILAAAAPITLPFERLGLPAILADNLTYRWEEAGRCVEARAWLAATALYGSILEIILPYWLGTDGRGQVDVLSKDRRTLAELIRAAEKEGLIDQSLARHAQALRESRNLIHPDKNIRERSTPDANLAVISKQVAQAVLDRLASIKGQAPA